jgi:hypothetical protein
MTTEETLELFDALKKGATKQREPDSATEIFLTLRDDVATKRQGRTACYVREFLALRQTVFSID